MYHGERSHSTAPIVTYYYCIVGISYRLLHYGTAERWTNAAFPTPGTMLSLAVFLLPAQRLHTNKCYWPINIIRPQLTNTYLCGESHRLAESLQDEWVGTKTRGVTRRSCIPDDLHLCNVTSTYFKNNIFLFLNRQKCIFFCWMYIYGCEISALLQRSKVLIVISIYWYIHVLYWYIFISKLLLNIPRSHMNMA